MVAAALVVLLTARTADQPIHIGDFLCHPRHLLAKFDSLKTAENSLPAGGKIVRWMPQINVAVIETPKNQLQLSRSRMVTDGTAKWVSFDYAAIPAYVPNDPMWPNMWHMTAIKADKAWDVSRGSSDAVVAVIDTGVDVAHEDLAANIWTNTGEIPGNGIDDDGNGYIDDVHGYDFAYDDSDPDDQFGHGTACAGLVAAVQDNSIGVTGVAPFARIMALKAGLDTGFFYDSATVPAYLYAADNGANVMSMSFFSDRVSPAEGDAINYCWQHGVLPVAAAGNSASVYPYYPGAYDKTLCVAALDTNLNKAGFSNFGIWVDVAAPGVSLVTTTPGNGYTTGFAGTSGACPQVAGLAALLFGANPFATAAQVRAAIEDTAVPVNQPPFGEFCNYGVIDCEQAMLAIVGAAAPQRTPTVRAVTAIGTASPPLPVPSLIPMSFRVLGRGFAAAATAQIFEGSGELSITDRQRDTIDADCAPLPSADQMEVYLDGALVSTLAVPEHRKLVLPLIDASTPGGGATSSGGFIEALNRDNLIVQTTRRTDGTIILQGTFMKVKPGISYDLHLRHQYTGTTVGTESIQLYDWSSASYPYGNFVTVYSGPVPTVMSNYVVPVTDPDRFIDFEGTVYLRIVTSNDLDTGAELHVDMANLCVRTLSLNSGFGY
ncbi:MAG TPA: S8 family peptidase [Fimbriimonadaceae bacterium]|nr:S8 family peptidase [Fimbriimonadaceae bacterium]